MTKPGSLTNAALAKRLARTSDLNEAQADAVVEAFVGSLREAILRGESTVLQRFGSFHPRVHPSYRAFNPCDRVFVTAPARRRIRFKLAKELREGVRAGAGGADG